ncbi:MAG: hypothetical protein H9Q65_04595 [Spiroplasma ixodetis]|nr:hypothetical protein [Spiroplasma ixodetis]MBP1528501.1 hypothetical protein [Spiroplasma ixodetis]
MGNYYSITNRKFLLNNDTTTYGIYLGVALGLIGIYTIVASSKLRWQA